MTTPTNGVPQLFDVFGVKVKQFEFGGPHSSTLQLFMANVYNRGAWIQNIYDRTGLKDEDKIDPDVENLHNISMQCEQFVKEKWNPFVNDAVSNANDWINYPGGGSLDGTVLLVVLSLESRMNDLIEECKSIAKEFSIEAVKVRDIKLERRRKDDLLLKRWNQ